ncbi:uncharacterized protein METZ01_LOCUS126567 [marine metagenome]|uniref:Uncharacterized protein n=1 Tax=marine metagenome TaxID=408172 RepID=A0A381YB36_9ZZZZ
MVSQSTGTTSGCEVHILLLTYYQQPELIPDPIRVSKVLSKEKLHSSSLVGSGISNMNKNHALCGRPIHCARFCSYAFLSKCIWVNMKFKKSRKRQASSKNKA